MPKLDRIGKLGFTIIILFLVFSGVKAQDSTVDKKQDLSDCEKAGGKLTKVKECDNSESDWCTISEKEQCYVDQVKDGKCTVGQYSEELKGIVGISPRVLCDKEQ